MAAVTDSMAEIVISKAQVLLQDTAAEQLMDNVADLTKTDVAADMSAKAAAQAATQTTGPVEAAVAATLDVAETLMKEVHLQMVAVHQADKTIRQHTEQVLEAELALTAKGRVAMVTIHLGTVVTRQAAVATAAQAELEVIMVKIHGVVRDRVQITHKAVNTAVAVADREQVGLLVQETVTTAL
jgi:hypothetical protein